MVIEQINYTIENKDYCAYFSVPEGDAAAPAVLIAHAWKGQDGFVKEIANKFTEKGYIALAADVYGAGVLAANNEGAEALMTPLFFDRTELRKRITAAFEQLYNHPRTDKKRIAAMGFCFGGLTVLELLRSGAPLQGIVSFHGVLTNSMGGKPANVTPLSGDIKAAALFLHGAKDPLMNQSDIDQVTQEMTQAGVDWQLIQFSEAAHAFTNPEANDSNSGLVYHEGTANRAWNYCNLFLTEALS